MRTRRGLDGHGVLAADTSAVADADGTPQGGFVFTYQWQRGVTVTDAQSGQDTTTWTDITDADGATYTPVQADVGHTLQVVVSFTDAAGNDESLTSAATAAVTDINEAPTGTVRITGTVEQGATLRADTSAIADPDGMPQGGFDFSYQWQRGVTDPQSGQTTTTWNDIGSATGATYTLVQTDVGQRLRVVVDFADAAGHAGTLTSAATGTVRDVTAITMNRVATGPVVIRGALRQGQALAADTGTIADADGEPQGGFDFSYQWQRGVTTTDSPSGPPTTTWSDIQDATLATYDLVQADVGQRVRVVVRFADAAGHAETLTGAATGTVTNVNDPPAGSAVVTGLPAGALQADVSELVDPDGLPADSAAYRYQWQRSTDNGNTWADISGATGSTYGLGSADVGSRFRVVVSFIDGQGTLERLTSASTEAVASRPSLVVADNRAAQVGSVLQSGAGTLGEGDEEVELTAWQWQRRSDEPGSGSARVRRSTPPGDGWVDIEGATAAAYELTEADVGQQVRVVVSGESGDGAGGRMRIERAASLEVQVKDRVPAGLEVVWVAPATGGSIAESTDVSATPLKVADLAVHDGDGEAIADLSGLTFALSGADADVFEVVGTALYLRPGTVLDYETISSYAVTLTLTDGDGRSVDRQVRLTVVNVSEPPAAPDRLEVDGTPDAGLVVSWAPVSVLAGTPGVTGYEIRYRSVGSTGDWLQVEVSGTRVDLPGLVWGRRYEVQVRALNADGRSAWSDTVEGRAVEARVDETDVDGTEVVLDLVVSVTGEARADEVLAVVMRTAAGRDYAYAYSYGYQWQRRTTTGRAGLA